MRCYSPRQFYHSPERKNLIEYICMLHVHRKVSTLQLELSFLNFKMFHFKISPQKCNLVWQKCIGNAAYISNNLALSARNHGCTIVFYKLKSLDVELNNNTQNQINGIAWLQFVRGEWIWLINSPRAKGHSPRVTGECNSRALFCI